jgi:hypothetical protein
MSLQWPQVIRSLRRLARTVLLSYLAAACTAWHMQTVSPAEAFAEPVKLARVSLADGSMVTIREPRVRSDSLFGRDASDESRRIGIALASIRAVELLEPSKGRSLALGMGIFLTMVVLLGVIVSIGLSSQN